MTVSKFFILPFSHIIDLIDVVVSGGCWAIDSIPNVGGAVDEVDEVFRRWEERAWSTDQSGHTLSPQETSVVVDDVDFVGNARQVDRRWRRSRGRVWSMHQAADVMLEDGGLLSGCLRLHPQTLQLVLLLEDQRDEALLC